MNNFTSQIASELSLQEYQVNNAIKLLIDEECTIPFVARYRKEMTGAMDEIVLRDVRDRYEYISELETNKQKYLKVVEEHCKRKPELQAKWPELQNKFQNCATKQELEDLYLPFKPKRRTRAQIAREKGLEPLVQKIMEQYSSIESMEEIAREFVTGSDNTDVEPALRVNSEAEALKGAADILAENIAETAEYRAIARKISQETGLLVSKRIEPKGVSAEGFGASEDAPFEGNKKEKDNAAKYENYFDYSESINTAASHRIMAVRRGEAEKVLRVNIEVDSDAIKSELKAIVINEGSTDAVRSFLDNTIEDAYRRLLNPSIETELRLQLKNSAEQEAIKVFTKNLENLLLLPPIPNKVVLGVDPGLRTGSKLAVVDTTGKYLASTTIHPDFRIEEDSPKNLKAKKELLNLIEKFNVEYLAVGNGTGSREINRFIAITFKDNEIKHLKRLTVNEAGASVYSAEDIAIEEFPDLDITIRSAISIARRLQDPLAEMVKINPRSIGVGQYQHDVNVTKLNRSLTEVVESCVNKVGVNVNTASYSLLGYVSGINKTLAKNIVAKRDKDGIFKSRKELLEVTGFGPKAFEQASGFLRIPESENPLENSAVHPESYELVEKFSTDQSIALKELIGNKDLLDSLPLENYVTETVGMLTLNDIVAELLKPGRDPREEGTRLHFSDEISEMEDLEDDMILPGTVTNVTNFGAFVDIGVHQDGLVHISELTDKFVDDPSKVVSVGDVLKVRVIDVDLRRRRISLSCRLEKSDVRPEQSQDKGANRRQNGGSSFNQNRRTGSYRGRNNNNNTNNNRRPDRSRGQNSSTQRGGQNNRPSQPKYTMDDLLAKFNSKR